MNKLVSVGEYCPQCVWLSLCGGCEQLWYVENEKQHPEYSVYCLHPERNDFAERVTEIGGFSIASIRAVEQKIPSFPGVIPMMRKDDLQGQWGAFSYVAIAMRDLLSRDLSMPTLRSTHRLRPRTPLLITGCCQDPVLESLWVKRESRELIAMLHRERPCLMFAPDFSLYVGFPRCTHQFNTKRSLLMFEIFQKAGLASVPFVSLHNEFDVKKWSEWLGGNPAVRTAAVSFQTLKNARRLWLTSASLLERLDRGTGCRIHWLVVGVAAGWKIRRLHSAIRSFSLLASEPVMSAVRGYQMINGRAVENHSLECEALVRCNLQDLERRLWGLAVLDFDNRPPNHLSGESDTPANRPRHEPELSLRWS